MPASGDVTVRVIASTLNYKDGLAITGKSPIIRTFPMTPRVDFAGVVEESASPAFVKGDRVLLNGWGVGETHPGGLAEKAKVKAEWLQPIPDGLTARQTMALGTAGYTAMLCVMALEAHGVTPDQGEILVTGAGGGVGGVALQLLKKLGYKAVASTGRPAEAEYLKKMGADSILDRNELSAPGKPLGKERWAGAIDSVGSHTLANVCAQTKYRATVAACGLAQGMDFPATVAPFILRGVTLAGVDSVRRPMPDRRVAWSRLAELIDPDHPRGHDPHHHARGHHRRRERSARAEDPRSSRRGHRRRELKLAPCPARRSHGAAVRLNGRPAPCVCSGMAARFLRQAQVAALFRRIP